MSDFNIPQGITTNKNFTVKDEWSADIVGTGSVPVLSTAILIQCVEIMANDFIFPYLDSDFVSVGSKLEISHLYPVAIGDCFEIELTLNEVEDKHVDFTVTAKQGNHVIASGFHRRHIVNREKFMKRLEDNCKKNKK